jgi:hypothetical protein
MNLVNEWCEAREFELWFGIAKADLQSVATDQTEKKKENSDGPMPSTDFKHGE